MKVKNMSNGNKYKVVVSDTVIVQVAGNTGDANGRQVPFKFSLVCKRKTQDDITAALNGVTLTKELLREVTTDWRGQTLVLEQDDTPAAFSPDAFDALLDIAGMPSVCLNKYLTANGAVEKN
jgi:hypothetical protein